MKLNITNWFTKRKQQTKLSTFTPLPQVRMPDENRDRQPYDHQSILQQSLLAWRTNPLARRIVGLTSQYVVGGGIRIQCDHPATQRFLDQWWQADLNQCALRVYEWCDELTRSGELFFLLSTDLAGMSYVRAVPAAQIERIETTQNDLQQEICFVQSATTPFEEAQSWPCVDALNDQPDRDGRYATVMLHFAINRPVGAVRGESDLAPILRWLNRYAAWLEDRARLNRYRNAFYFVVRSRFVSENERAARQATFNLTPPSPGSILVTDESEQWDVIHPRLESNDANADGLAIKKMIAAGAGLPLHFLAEPESSTRTTAEAAGGPTFRHFEQRQQFFCEMIRQLARVSLNRRAHYDSSLNPLASLQVMGADLSARDNASLAIATRAASRTFTDLFDRGLIGEQELLRMVYRFAGEVVNPDLVGKGSPSAARRPPQGGNTNPKDGINENVINPETGEYRGRK
ncbi:MAG: hypothetical protein CVU46_11275 [Chloroflexi bacterium HGW-Chloroflexi-8]|nr:MAG: hypothetical protein CVU46_11275 [Chloroflexi bacterium HGW-Chloroflexi-8]